LMTQLPPPPKIELDDDKLTKEKKKRIYGSALVPSFEGLVLFKEQLASSKNVLTVCVKERVRVWVCVVCQFASVVAPWVRHSSFPVQVKYF
jgi:hypothetical protein